jgi:hypothetical protein
MLTAPYVVLLSNMSLRASYGLFNLGSKNVLAGEEDGDEVNPTPPEK